MKKQNFVGQFNLQPRSKNLITEGGLRTTGIFKNDTPDSALVSVITVVRNAADTIQRCINSVRTQTYPNVEHILIDGASTDGTIEVISRNEQFLDYFISEPDSGIYEAMNKGLSLAQGQHIIMLNADDWLISDGIRKLNEKIMLDNADFAIGHANFVDEDGRQFYTAKTDSFDDRILVSGMSFCHQAVLASKLCFDEVEFFDESLKLSGDYKWIRQLFWTGKTATLVDQPVVNFSYTGLTKTHRPIMKREAQILFLKDFNFISPQQAEQFFEFVYRDAPLNSEFYETLRLGKENNQFLLSMSMFLVQRLIESEEIRTKQRVLDLQSTRTLAIELFRRLARKVLGKARR